MKKFRPFTIAMYFFAFLWFLITNPSYAQNYPMFSWAKTFSGINFEAATGIIIDSAGNPVVSGFFSGIIDMDPGPGTLFMSSQGYTDCFISKLSPTGSQIWSKTFGGVAEDMTSSIAISSTQDVISTGWFQDTCHFQGFPSLTALGNFDAFIVRINSSGNFIFAKQVGGPTGNVHPVSVTCDQENNIIIAGKFTGTVDFDPGPGIFNLTCGTAWDDMFVLKLDSTGDFIWVNHFVLSGTVAPSSMGHGEINDIKSDFDNNIYITGGYSGTVDLDPGPSNYTVSTGGLLQWTDGFILKVTKDGHFVWGQPLYSGLNIDYDSGQSIALSETNDIYISGVCASCFSGSTFLTKIDTAGNLKWTKEIGELNPSFLNSAIITDGPDSITLAGTFQSTADFDPGPGVVNLAPIGVGTDAYICKLDSAGNFAWVISLEGPGYISDIKTGMIVNDHSQGLLMAGGFTGQSDFNPSTTGTFNLTGGQFNNDDAFVVKLTNFPCILDTTLTVQSGTLTSNVTNAFFQWLDCNNNYAAISGETNNSFTAPSNGSYAVQITQGGCIDTSNCYIITTVGISQPSSENFINVFPNPTSDKLTIQINSINNDEAIIKIHDLIGRIVHLESIQVHSGLNETIIDVDDKKRGIYSTSILLDSKILRIPIVLGE